MKRIISILICVLFALSLGSCGESVNMAALTEYQRGNFSAELKISIQGREYRASLLKEGERLQLSVKEPAALSPYVFLFENGCVFIVTDGTEIPFDSGGDMPLTNVYGLFCVSVAGTWKIEKARPGGVSLYVCECDGVRLYIDANSRLPLKIVSGGTEIDVLGFTVLKG